MSRPYRITVKESYKEVIVADDSIKTKLDIIPILPPDRSGVILADVLRRRGFTDSDDDILVRENGGVKTEIDPKTGNVTVSSSSSEEINLDGEGDLPSCPCAERSRESVAAGLRKKLQIEAGRRADSLQEAVTDRLEKATVALGCELEKIVAEVTVTSLKEKAATLGEIKEVSGDKGGTTTIVVKVEN